MFILRLAAVKNRKLFFYNSKVRLWLQAYPGRGDYGIAQYKLQRKAAQDAGSWGWMFWNPHGNYDVRMFAAPGE